MANTGKLTMPLPMTEDDYEASATVRDLQNLDYCLRYMRMHDGDNAFSSSLDLGCGRGWLTTYVANDLGISTTFGIDRDDERLAVAAERGVQVWNLDLERDPFPLGDHTQDLISSFGMFEHMVYYDHALVESFRVLRPGGWLLVAMPNLGSYLNRASLLIGAQPRNVEISKEVPAGILSGYKGRLKDGKPLGHVHAATLSAMKEVTAHHGFHVRLVRTSSPDFGSRLLRIADATVGRFPSLARRYIIVAQKPDARQTG